MVTMKDEIVRQLVQAPQNPELVRDLGNIYLMWNESPATGSGGSGVTGSEASLKLAIHYLEQSIQLG